MSDHQHQYHLLAGRQLHQLLPRSCKFGGSLKAVESLHCFTKITGNPGVGKLRRRTQGLSVAGDPSGDIAGCSRSLGFGPMIIGVDLLLYDSACEQFKIYHYIPFYLDSHPGTAWTAWTADSWAADSARNQL